MTPELEPLQLRAVDWDVPVMEAGSLLPGTIGVVLSTAAEAPALLLQLSGTSARAAVVTLRAVPGQPGGVPAVIPFTRGTRLFPYNCVVYSIGPEPVCPRLAAGQVKRGVTTVELVVEVDERWAENPLAVYQ